MVGNPSGPHHCQAGLHSADGFFFIPSRGHPEPPEGVAGSSQWPFSSGGEQTLLLFSRLVTWLGGGGQSTQATPSSGPGVLQPPTGESPHVFAPRRRRPPSARLGGAAFLALQLLFGRVPQPSGPLFPSLCAPPERSQVAGDVGGRFGAGNQTGRSDGSTGTPIRCIQTIYDSQGGPVLAKCPPPPEPATSGGRKICHEKWLFEQFYRNWRKKLAPLPMPGIFNQRSKTMPGSCSRPISRGPYGGKR